VASGAVSRARFSDESLRRGRLDQRSGGTMASGCSTTVLTSLTESASSVGSTGQVEARAVTNFAGNAAATVIAGTWKRESTVTRPGADVGQDPFRRDDDARRPRGCGCRVPQPLPGSRQQHRRSVGSPDTCDRKKLPKGGPAPSDERRWRLSLREVALRCAYLPAATESRPAR